MLQNQYEAFWLYILNFVRVNVFWNKRNENHELHNHTFTNSRQGKGCVKIERDWKKKNDLKRER